MPDPAQLSSTIEELEANTVGLDPDGDPTFNVPTVDYLAESVGAGLTAVGTDRTTSLQLDAALNLVTGGATGSGVCLPDLSGSPGADVIVINANASAIKVYAPGSQTIDGTAGSSGVTLTNAKRCIYFMTSSTAWVSAQLGVVSA